MKAKRSQILLIFSFLSLLIGCHPHGSREEIPSEFLGYQPEEPRRAMTTEVFDKETKKYKEVYWEDLSDSDKRSLLTNQKVEITIGEYSISGKVSYFGSSVSRKKGVYRVVMDYFKYRFEPEYDESDKYLGSNRIGVGLRLKATVVTTEDNLKLSGPLSIGFEASRGKLTGTISLDVIGIDSKDITNLTPIAISQIDQSSIASAMQAIGTIKSKIWDEGTTITPHLIASYTEIPNSRDKILRQASTYAKTISSECILKYWKPDGQIDTTFQRKILNWLESQGQDSKAGLMTMFVYGSDFSKLRKQAIKYFAIDCGNNEGK